MKPIVFKSEGYDPFIDYLKGICILWVVMTHAISPMFHDWSLFCLWGDMAVPIFLLIQCIHVYKKNCPSPKINWKKTWTRVIYPFIKIQILIVVIGIIILLLSRHEIKPFLLTFLREGGIGKGLYYPKMYLEFVILIPLCFPILKKHYILAFGGGILLSFLFEVLFNIYSCHILWEWICFRYFFIIILGYLIAKKGVVINTTTILLSLFSAVFIIILEYTSFTFYPFIYRNLSKTHHWFCYFYVAFLLVYIIKILEDTIPRTFKSLLLKMGKYSYEIFLFQMLVFFIADSLNTVIKYLTEDYLMLDILWRITLILMSIMPVLIYKQLTNNERIQTK